ncbi:hypothetical protein SAMN05216334_10568 [Nitrosomonas ureae]|uniref:Uncharacterized protein n=1 Tax=Nitrosomonas ureae TaxID=44577 RepID=A0A1H5TMP6_9PROT|nr:hypothetical protein SAMN05216334_10568 [Nitrosomonas ureae]
MSLLEWITILNRFEALPSSSGLRSLNAARHNHSIFINEDY